jgi:MinD superfamily P-loop ATPase
MRIAVLSGKGGTGKTLVSVNLAAAAQRAVYIDCDVEEPNGHLFFKPEGVREEAVCIRIPRVQGDLCDGCRQCVDFCNFNALAYIRDQLMVFEEVCHSCGGCVLLCPQKALAEREKRIGAVREGQSGGVEVCTGILNIGEASGVPVIKKLLDGRERDDALTVIDCPPGSACAVMECVQDADYCVLIAEPTVFGVHNLHMVCELARLFQKPFGVVLNQCTAGENPAEEFCLENGIPILGRLAFDRTLGKLNSNAKIAVRESEAYRTLFRELLDTVIGEVHREAAAHS